MCRSSALTTIKEADGLGFRFRTLLRKWQRRKNLKNDDGAYVSDVLDDSPADSAGVKEGDVIVEFNGKTIDDAGRPFACGPKIKARD